MKILGTYLFSITKTWLISVPARRFIHEDVIIGRGSFSLRSSTANPQGVAIASTTINLPT